MAKQKPATEPAGDLVGAGDGTYAIALEVVDRLSALRLVYRAIEGIENLLPGNKELAAACDRLGRLRAEVEPLHNRVDLLGGLLGRGRQCDRSTERARELRGVNSLRKARRLS